MPVVHIGAVRQTARIVRIATLDGGDASGGDGPQRGQDATVVRSGERARITFRFPYRAEHVQVGDKVLFRDGKAKGVGVVVTRRFDDGASRASSSETGGDVNAGKLRGVR